MAFDQMGDAVGQHPRLARAGTGDDQKWATVMHDGLELARVQTGQQRVDRYFGLVGRHRTPTYPGRVTPPIGRAETSPPKGHR